jgi:hypothetical protein
MAAISAAEGMVVADVDDLDDDVADDVADGRDAIAAASAKAASDGTKLREAGGGRGGRGRSTEALPKRRAAYIGGAPEARRSSSRRLIFTGSSTFWATNSRLSAAVETRASSRRVAPDTGTWER